MKNLINKAASILTKYKLPILVFLISRISILYTTYAGTVLLKQAMYHQYGNWFLSNWLRWDSYSYISIAQNGYVNNEAWRQAFFPFYPLLIKTFNYVISDYSFSAIIVSNLAFLFSLIILYRLTLKYFDKDTSLRTIILISVFPASFFFVCGLTESVFLLLALSTFYWAEKDNWLFSGACGMLASLTRSNGILLFIPILLFYLHKKEWKIKNIKLDIAYLLLIPFGLFIFMGYLKLIGLSPTAFLDANLKYWPRALSYPWWDLIRTFIFLIKSNILNLFVNDFPINTFNHFIFVILFICSLLFIYRTINPFYAIYSGLMILYFLLFPAKTSGADWTSGWYLYSSLRFLAVIFPAFMWLGWIAKNKIIYLMLIIIFTMLLTIFSVVNGLGGWIA